MCNIVSIKTGEVYDSFETAHEAIKWINNNCEVTQIYNCFGNIENRYCYKDNLIKIRIN